MTFGNQNTLEEGVEQLNTAFDEYGINFIDTAEMYPVPTDPKTQGRTDLVVAEFLRGRNRDDVVLATKVTGRSDRITWLPRRTPDTPAELNREQIIYSVNESLRRLDTHYIDLLQLHFPDRYTGGLFGQPDFSPSEYKGDYNPLEEQLSALRQLIDEGKVRYVGISNETPYGVCSMVELAKQDPISYPKIDSIQNSYSLVVRKDFEAGLAEACFHHRVGLLAYSPLAGGTLSGKYRDPEKVPDNARLKVFPGFMDRYLGSLNEEAVNAYCELALSFGCYPAELALSWCYHREHVASTIIGATSMEQLHENIKTYDKRLDKGVLEKIDSIYRRFTDPTKR
jgi:aryl-alcohol dehydrogenase-like predicted oxidoreductase